MCNLTKSLPQKTAIGYKVAFKKRGKYYSPCTGIEYISGMEMPLLQSKRANRLTDVVNTRFLNPYADLFYGFKSAMQGRTAAFKYLVDAEDFAEELEKGMIVSGYKSVILRVSLSKDLLEGVYGRESVRAGRKMKILKEVK